MIRKLSAFILAALLSAGGFAQVTTDTTKTGIVTTSTLMGTATATASQTGTGNVYVTNSSPTINTPTFVAPALGTPASGVATNFTGTAASLTAGTATFATSAGSAGTVTTNANLTGPVSSTGNATTLTAVTGTGSTIVLATSPVLTTPRFATSTWANLPSAGGNTYTFQISTDIGTNGSVVQSTGARWRPLNSLMVLTSLPAVTTGIANTETILMQTQLPAAALQVNDVIRIYGTPTKSGTTDGMTMTFRIGTGGTTSDTSIYGALFLTAANMTGGFILDLRVTSATSILRVGTNSVTGSYQGQSPNGAVAPTTISNISNSLYITVTGNSTSTNNTVGMQTGRIEWLTP